MLQDVVDKVSLNITFFRALHSIVDLQYLFRIGDYLLLIDEVVDDTRYPRCLLLLQGLVSIQLLQEAFALLGLVHVPGNC